jgi:hypothetical protein
MPHLTTFRTPTSSPQLRILRDESAPPYDGIAPAPAKRRHMTAIEDDVVEAITEQCGLTALGLYTLMERRTNQDCHTFGSYQDWADMAGITRRHVIRLMGQLIAGGWVHKNERTTTNGMSRTNVWTLPFHRKQRTYGSDTTGDINAQVMSPPLLTVTTVSPVPSVPVTEEPEIVNTCSAAKKSAPTYTEAFETFWRLYPSGRGNKFPSFKHWKRMSAADQDAALVAIPKWKAAWGDVQFIPYCEKWLGERRWENDPPVGAKGEINHNAGGRGIWVG